jgi:hypothetical protein
MHYLLSRITRKIRKIKYRLFGIGRVVKRRELGIRYPYYLREGTSDEHVEQDVFRMVPIYTKDDFGSPHWIIDAGANIGLRTNMVC